MPDLNFQVTDITPEQFAATPSLNFKLHITQSDGATPIHTVALRCQIRIDPARRRYSPAEEPRLLELFGERPRWPQTMHSLLWTHASAMIPSFTSSITADLSVPCTFDFNVATTKYFDSLDDGSIPLSLLFSGTIFYQSESGDLQAAPISWEKEAAARLPVQVWRDMMDHYYPNTAFLSLSKETFDRLHRYKSQNSYMTWDSALEDLLTQRVPQ